MVLNIILFVSMYPCILIVYFVIKGSGKNRNGTVFGLCVPKDAALAEEFDRRVQEKQVWYQRRMRTTLIIFLVLPLVSFAIPYVSIQFTFWMFWLLASLVLFYVPCILANLELKAWKKSVQVQAEKKQENINLVELSEAGQVRKVKLLPFLIPTLAGAAVAIAYYVLCGDSLGRGMTWIIAVFAACTPMFYIAACWMDHQRTAVVSYNSEVNLNYARAKKQIWNRLWLSCAWINTIFTAFSGIALADEGLTVMWLLWGTVVYIAAISLLVIAAIRKVNRLEQRYEKKIDPLLKEEDDDCWIGGVVYYNKSDKRTLVETRIGYGTAVNMATPLGKGLMAFGAASLLLIPIACIWMILLEFTPIRLDISGDFLIAEQLKTDYKIAVSDISELELVEELPKLSKNAGTGMDNLYKGNWHITYAGDCEVFLNPQNGLFLKFTSDGVLYYMSGTDDGQTREMYEELEAR